MVMRLRRCKPSIEEVGQRLFFKQHLTASRALASGSTSGILSDQNVWDAPELRQRVYRTPYVEIVHKSGQPIGVKNEEPDIAAVLASKETKLTPRDAFDSWKRVGRSQINLPAEIPSQRTKAGLGSDRIGHVQSNGNRSCRRRLNEVEIQLGHKANRQRQEVTCHRSRYCRSCRKIFGIPSLNPRVSLGLSLLRRCSASMRRTLLEVPNALSGWLRKRKNIDTTGKIPF